MRTATIEERFEEFHAANPGVYLELRRLSLRLVDAGQTRFGIATVYEALRYSQLQTYGDSFKLNNSYRALYARLLMEQEPRLAGVFETRQLRAPVLSSTEPRYAVEPDTGQGLIL